MIATLAEMSPGQVGRVLSVDGEEHAVSRMLEMGLTPGVEIKFLGTSLLGDPIEVQVRGYRLSLRKLEALKVKVDLTSVDPV